MLANQKEGRLDGTWMGKAGAGGAKTRRALVFARGGVGCGRASRARCARQTCLWSAAVARAEFRVMR